MLGQSELNLTVASVDLVASKDFGVGGTFRLSPYLGANLLVAFARSEVIDATPDVDALEMPVDRNADFAFVDQEAITRQRGFLGAKLTYAVLTAGLEIALARRGRSTDDRAGTSTDCADAAAPTTACDARDRAGRQVTVTATLGAEF
jgi:hypothetical protein